MKILMLFALTLTSFTANADILVRHGYPNPSNRATSVKLASIVAAQDSTLFTKKIENTLEVYIGNQRYSFSKSVIDRTGLTISSFYDLLREAAQSTDTVRIDLFKDKNGTVTEIQRITNLGQFGKDAN